MISNGCPREDIRSCVNICRRRGPRPSHDACHLHGAGEPDYSSEERMVRLFRVALALQPLATALWANSPFREGEKKIPLS